MWMTIMIKTTPDMASPTNDSTVWPKVGSLPSNKIAMTKMLIIVMRHMISIMKRGFLFLTFSQNYSQLRHSRPSEYRYLISEWQSSQQHFLGLFTSSFCFNNLVSIKEIRQFLWMCLIEPVHLQGFIKGSY